MSFDPEELPFTAQDIVRAYRETGLTPVAGEFYADHAGPCGCPLTALAVSNQPDLSDELEQIRLRVPTGNEDPEQVDEEIAAELAQTVQEQLPPTYHCEFCCGVMYGWDETARRVPLQGTRFDELAMRWESQETRFARMAGYWVGAEAAELILNT